MMLLGLCLTAVFGLVAGGSGPWGVELMFDANGVEEILLQQQNLQGLEIPRKKLNNGVEMPMMGLGTWEYNTSTTYQAVKLALSLGYDHIDTAMIYGNQKGVGQAVKEWLTENQKSRQDVFITTKIPGGLNYSAATAALESTLKDLQMEYVDMMLVHFPADWDGHGGPEMRIQGWKAMEHFHKSGKARAIGISHYCKRHIEEILEHGTVKPALNQVEYHVGMGSAGDEATDYKEWTEQQGITFMSFSPLCGPCGTDELIKGDLVTNIGKKYNKTGAQVSLRWQTQQGIPVIPKTTSEKHMLQNADIFNWNLSDEDMATLTQAKSPPVTGGGGDGTSGDCKIARRRLLQ